MARARVFTVSLLLAAAATLLAGCSFAAVPPVDGTVRMSGSWTRLPASPLPARHEAISAWMDGKFVVVGGRATPPCPPAAACTAPEEPALRDGAAFDPVTGEWEAIEAAPVPVSGNNAVVLDCALYLLTGELWRGDSPVAVLRYSLETDTWTRLPAPPGPHARLLAAGDHLLAISPSDELQPSRDWIFDPATETWARLPDDPLGPSFDREAVWVGGAVLLTGKDLIPSPGSTEPSVVRLARLDLDSREWTELPDSDIIGWSPRVAGDLVVFPHVGSADGGEVNNWGRDVPYGGILDPATEVWRDLPAPPGGGLKGEILVLGNRVLVGGHLLDPDSGDWTLLPELPSPDRDAAAVAAGGDAILVWGGSTGTQNLADGYLLRLPPTPTSTPTLPPTPSPTP